MRNDRDFVFGAVVSAAAVLLFIATLRLSAACNEGLCASRVSKCLLIKSCDCDLSDKKNCSCCKNCSTCLNETYTDCCSCVGLCHIRRSKVALFDLSNLSTIGDLEDPIPDLFNLLTEEEDELSRWSIYRYPAYGAIATRMSYHIESQPEAVAMVNRFAEYYNCTVTYFPHCKSLLDCRESCRSMGASRVRWFHSGCCECVAHTCADYGLEKSKCLRCADFQPIDVDTKAASSSATSQDNESHPSKETDEPKQLEKSVDTPHFAKDNDFVGSRSQV